MDMHEFWMRRLDRIRRRRLRAFKAAKEAVGGVSYDVVCRYWLADKCAMAERCPFLHAYISDKIPLCAYIDARCASGDSCLFRHHYNPGERARVFTEASRVNMTTTKHAFVVE